MVVLVKQTLWIFSVKYTKIFIKTNEVKFTKARQNKVLLTKRIIHGRRCKTFPHCLNIHAFCCCLAFICDNVLTVFVKKSEQSLNDKTVRECKLHIWYYGTHDETLLFIHLLKVFFLNGIRLAFVYQSIIVN